ncbi:cytochrome ubiquinol oxidase subunit I [Streptantibioticus silvisoli]|uniref:Cytochrome ubiquinol oxidase subunit I n=1 Tax=Streptantibioticus silvisoli TaxID=2705255 RepID=A0ABT6VU02_9ACTN|nr:cytochrome ubiquinol oxidase subunit I [Streptantibioticus silvisoli]MDI5961950.1 cytochrome ubiquinol oxidase subunit I [Streptantibioticus silvisoli]
MDLALAPETLARWQFGITTVYHFLFVPLTISLSAFTAGLETAWIRTGKEKYFHATKFWGKLFLINIAMGVVTGIVQEFQFGMNWSAYSRFVGDVFGAPLAMEALIAFFFESTFVGLWIFGWDKLPRKLHCACIWIVAVGTLLSAYFILAANSFMQHPNGYVIDPHTHRARLTSIVSVLTQNTTLVQGAHTLFASFLTGAALVVGVSSFHLWRAKRAGGASPGVGVSSGAGASGVGVSSGARASVAGSSVAGSSAAEGVSGARASVGAGRSYDKKIGVMRTSLRAGLVLAVIAGMGTAVSGDALGKVMFQQQPMKMAAAEALWKTSSPAPFSIFAVGDVDKGHNTVELSVPGLLSFLAHDDFRSSVPGIDDVARQEAAEYGSSPRDYIPDIFVTFWGFRLMMGFGMTSAAAAFVGLWTTRRRFWLAPRFRTAEDEVPRLMLTRHRELWPAATRWSWRIGILTMGFPLAANSFGWVFTEMGRQPWVVYGLMKTSDAVSPGVTTFDIATSLSVFTLLYAVLAVIEVRLMARYAKAGPVVDEQPPPPVTFTGLTARLAALAEPAGGDAGADGAGASGEQAASGGGNSGAVVGAGRDPDGSDSAESDKPMIFAY